MRLGPQCPQQENELLCDFSFPVNNTQHIKNNLQHSPFSAVVAFQINYIQIVSHVRFQENTPL